MKERSEGPIVEKKERTTVPRIPFSLFKRITALYAGVHCSFLLHTNFIPFNHGLDLIDMNSINAITTVIHINPKHFAIVPDVYCRYLYRNKELFTNQIHFSIKRKILFNTLCHLLTVPNEF